MELTPVSSGSSFAESSPRPEPRLAVADRLSDWTTRSKRAAVAFVLVGSAFFAGPVPVASAARGSAGSSSGTVSSLNAAASSEAERALGARLTVEYAGAVPAADVESLVRRVSRHLRQEASPPERLLRTAEAICRRALTDYLARRLQLPFA